MNDPKVAVIVNDMSEVNVDAALVRDGHTTHRNHEHSHGPNCGHQAVKHGDHVDYLVAGHLHHPNGSHCDDHGAVSVA